LAWLILLFDYLIFDFAAKSILKINQRPAVVSVVSGIKKGRISPLLDCFWFDF